MIEFTDKDKQRIRPLIERFTKLSINDNVNPRGFCLPTSFAISIYLDSLDISNNIIDGERKNVRHFWLHLQGYTDEVIIDSTIKQFAPNHDPIYIGKRSGDEVTAEYELKPNNNTFHQWIKSNVRWCHPEDGFGDKPPDKNFVRNFIIHNLINASILAYEIEKLETSTKLRVHQSVLFKYYFYPILKGLKNEWQTNDTIVNAVRKKVAQEFDFLKSKLI